MKRSGSTLHYQILSALVEQAHVGKRIEWVAPSDFQRVKKKYKSYSGIKIFKSHICTDEIAHEFSIGNAKGLYVYRDIRDVVLSSLKMAGSDFNHAWIKQLINECINEFYKWNALPNVMISQYEEVTNDLFKETKRIADYFGILVNDNKCSAIANELTLEKQKSRIIASNESAPPNKANTHSFHKETLLHYNHISSGQSEEWKNNLSRHQIFFIEKLAGEWLEKNDYSLSGFKPSIIETIALWLKRK